MKVEVSYKSGQETSPLESIESGYFNGVIGGVKGPFVKGWAPETGWYVVGLQAPTAMFTSMRSPKAVVTEYRKITPSTIVITE